jgi:tetratricopeptide (TPR) repeat protein
VWIFWIHASTRVRFRESYRQIADFLELERREDPRVDVRELVCTYLSKEANGDWLMVVDNADDENVLFGAEGEGEDAAQDGPDGTWISSKSCSQYLPVSSSGSLLFTSRVRGVVLGLGVAEGNVIDVGPMDMTTGDELLRRRLGPAVLDSTAELRRELVRELDGMALALTNAAAFINKCAPRTTVKGYIELLRQDDDTRRELLARSARDPRRVEERSNAIITTWQISFTHLRQTQRGASQLLALMSMFDREAIPDHILQDQYRNPNPSEIEFEVDVAALREYSLIRATTDVHVFDMHRLIQDSTQLWLSQSGQLQWWQRRYIACMSKAFPNGDQEHWAICAPLLPHVMMTMSYPATGIEHQTLKVGVLFRGAWYAKEAGQYEDAGRMLAMAVDICDHVNFQDRNIKGDNLDLLGLIERDRGQYSKAELTCRRALEARERLLGPQDRRTLISVSNLAMILQDQYRLEEAEKLNRRAYIGRRSLLGPTHRETLTSLNNLAMVLRYMERDKEAESLYRCALEASRQIHGEYHVSTLTIVGNISMVVQQLGRISESEEIGRQALAGFEAVLGMDHPTTLTSVDNLVSVLQEKGQLDEAEAQNRRALEGRRRALGQDHPDTLTTVLGLVKVLVQRQNFSAVVELYRETITDFVKALGADHRATQDLRALASAPFIAT